MWKLSHTLRGCVDWNSPVHQYGYWMGVTPCVGVWIETLANYLSLPQEIVTPCVGVWIETYKQGWQYYFTWMSHPAWVCGLKHDTAYIEKEKEGHTLRGCVDWNPWNGYFYKGLHCHTLRGCVDWNYGWCYEFYGISSHTLRGCVDWNAGILSWKKGTMRSHPAWVCGLKPARRMRAQQRSCVTPCVGVWIETPSTTWRRYLHMVTPCVGVYGLKHCSLVGQVYGRIVSIRPLVYFSSSCYKVKSQTKYVRLLTLLWLEKTRTIPDAYLLSVFFCGFT